MKPGGPDPPTWARELRGVRLSFARAMEMPGVQLAAIVLGIALRSAAWLGRSTMWLDEVAIARNVRERSLSELLTVPLDYGQTAPSGFLTLEWIATRLGGASDLSFRFIPLVASLLSLFLVRAIARRILTPAGTGIALVLFAVAYPPILYAAEAKHYSLDVTTFLALTLVAIMFVDDDFAPRRGRLAAVVGLTAPWFSYAAVLCAAGLGLALVAIALVRHGVARGLRAVALPVAAWGVSAGLASGFALHHSFPATMQYLTAFHQSGMPNLANGGRATLRWYWNQTRDMAQSLHGWSLDRPVWTSAYPTIAALGAAQLLVRRWPVGLLFIGGVAAFGVASVAHQYPYSLRLALPVFASLLFAVAAAGDWILTLEPKSPSVPAQILAAMLLVPPLYHVTTHRPPYDSTDIGGYLKMVGARWRQGDVLYVANYRALEVAYYVARSGIDSASVLLGPCAPYDPRRTFRALDRFRGKPRVWVLLSGGEYAPSPEYYYLRAIGREREALATGRGPSARLLPPAQFDDETAYLFDLDTGPRLARFTAATLPLSPLVPNDSARALSWRPKCFGVFTPELRQSAHAPVR